MAVRAGSTGHFPGLWRLPVFGSRLDRLACATVPNLFGDQFVITARVG
jgi:hypothetical protein